MALPGTFDVPLPLPELWEAVKWAVKPDGAVLFFAQCPYDLSLIHISPSMKLDRRYHCFGCGADGDVIDFVAALYGLGKKEAAVQLANDFGLSYEDWKPPGKVKKPKPRQKSPEIGRAHV